MLLNIMLWFSYVQICLFLFLQQAKIESEVVKSHIRDGSLLYNLRFNCKLLISNNYASDVFSISQNTDIEEKKKKTQ